MDLDLVRRVYARQVLALAGVGENAALEQAFAKVHREQFLGPPPWKLATPTGEYQTIPLQDTVVVYQDALFALDPGRGVNNGSPSLHARWLHALGPRRGDRVIHLGAGSGYYSAILGELVGAEGTVIAVEYDPHLADLARLNLAVFDNIRVVVGDGTRFPAEPADGIYVNFGVESPMSSWIDNLRDRGRLVFPLGYREAKRIAGGGFKIERRGSSFAASYLGPAYFIPAEGTEASPTDQRVRLKAAFEGSLARNVKSFIWQKDAPAARCWFAAEDWAFSYE